MDYGKVRRWDQRKEGGGADVGSNSEFQVNDAIGFFNTSQRF